MEVPRAQTDNTPPLANLKANSLRTAGIGYLVGDAALFAAGMLSGRYKEAATGLVWGAGGLVAARYGNPKAEQQLELLAHALGDHLRQKGVMLPSGGHVGLLNREGGVLEKIEEFLTRHPSEVLNAIYALGGSMLAKSGLEHGKHWDVASGALVAAGGLAGLLMNEKQPDKNNPPRTVFARAKSWMQEKPLRVSGTFYSINNVAMLLSALSEHRSQPANKSYVFKYLTAASYIFANTMLAMSSKDNIAADNQESQVTRELAMLSAQVIAAQPKELRDALIADVSQFLAHQSGASLNPEVFAAQITGQLAAMAPRSWQNRAPSSALQLSPALV